MANPSNSKIKYCLYCATTVVIQYTSLCYEWRPSVHASTPPAATRQDQDSKIFRTTVQDQARCRWTELIYVWHRLTTDHPRPPDKSKTSFLNHINLLVMGEKCNWVHLSTKKLNIDGVIVVTQDMPNIAHFHRVLSPVKIILLASIAHNFSDLPPFSNARVQMNWPLNVRTPII